jgi:two-component system, OmpR family, phosphate regulon sensor histidine kinase PhoR
VKKSLRRILAGLIILLFVPVGSVVFYEYTKISDNEKLISTVYKNQLESIVSSINSYSQDVLINWASRLELSLKFNSDSLIFNRLITENPAIKGIFQAQGTDHVQTFFVDSNATGFIDTIPLILKKESKSIYQLKAYYKNNYRKFISYSSDKNRDVIYFICQNKDNEPTVCLILIDMQIFLQSYISLQMQAIAQDNFLITLFSQTDGTPLISTDVNVESDIRYDQEGEMWLFPTIKIGISLKNQTIKDLAARRVKEGLILVGVLFFVLLAGIWFLYISVRREIQLAQIKSGFVSSVSHEIRTPLALISMYIETLEMGRVKTAEKTQEYYSIISKETQRLAAMVNKILSFSKMESGTRPFKSEVCNLNDITQKVVDTYRFHLGSKGFELQFTKGEFLSSMLGDAEAIGDAIINLIDNAIKYSRDIRQVEVTTGLLKDFVWVEVKDYGLGIAKKHQKLVFDKFYRVTAGNLANEVKGTGLGLSIVNETVKAHKGKITLQSKTGEGSTFKLFFPIIQESFKK